MRREVADIKAERRGNYIHITETQHWPERPQWDLSSYPRVKTGKMLPPRDFVVTQVWPINRLRECAIAIHNKKEEIFGDRGVIRPVFGTKDNSF